MTEEKKSPVPGGESKKPWPMSWVLIAILIYAVIHMLVTLLGS